MLKEQDFINAGYTPARAKQLANNPAFNWKASNGGKRNTTKHLGVAQCENNLKKLLT